MLSASCSLASRRRWRASVIDVECSAGIQMPELPQSLQSELELVIHSVLFYLLELL